MASVLVQIDGVIWDDADKSGKKVTIYGQMFRPDLGVGGGPIYPDPKPPGQPPGIWGPNDPRPTPPIHLGPGGDIGGPPVIGGGPIIPPDVPPDIEPPPPLFDWKVAWTPDTGWIVVGVPQVPHPVPSR